MIFNLFILQVLVEWNNKIRNLICLNAIIKRKKYEIRNFSALICY